MAMNINNINGGRSNSVDNNRTTDNRHVPKDTQNTQQTKTTSPQDSVVLTDKARQLNQIEQGLKQTSSSDRERGEKIAALKTAIANGDYQIDAPRVARKMSAMEDQLNGLYR